MTVGMSLANYVPMVMKYSYNVSAIKFLSRVIMSFIKNSWFWCDDFFLPIISLIICHHLSGHFCACQISFDNNSALLFL